MTNYKVRLHRVEVVIITNSLTNKSIKGNIYSHVIQILKHTQKIVYVLLSRYRAHRASKRITDCRPG